MKGYLLYFVDSYQNNATDNVSEKYAICRKLEVAKSKNNATKYP